MSVQVDKFFRGRPGVYAAATGSIRLESLFLEEKSLTRLPKPGRPIPMNYSSLFNRPQRVAARFRRTRSRKSACCCNAIRSAAAIKPWVGRTQAVGQRVIPLDRINSATATRSSSDIFDQIIHVSRRNRERQAKFLAAPRGFTEDPRKDRNIEEALRRFLPSVSTLPLRSIAD